MRHATRLSVALSAALVAVTPDAEAASVATGASHSVIVDGSGNVWAWGYNASGQLGTGDTTSSPLPIQVPGLSGIVAVAAGGDHTLALGSDGKVWAFGENGYGQLGDGTNTDRTSPVQVLTGASQIAAGATHSLALKADGTVMAWGLNNSGQLGDGTTTPQNAPQAVPSLSSVASIAAGSTHSIIAKTNGTVWAWGGNSYGQLGDGSNTNRTSPVQTIGLTGVTVTAVAGGTGHTLARTNTGLLYAWGLNNYGQLGDGTGENPRFAPERVADVQNIAVIAAGASHCAAAETDGTIWCWGKGDRGQIGDGEPMPATIPIPLAGPAGVEDLAASNGDHTVAVTDSGEVWAWGANDDGQIGDGTALDRMTPVRVMDAGFTLKVGTPIFSLTPATYFATQSVALSSATAGTTIRYTTDGTEPTVASTQYTAAIAVNVSTTIRAIAFKTGVADSNVATGAFTLRVAQPVLSPGSGNYSSAQSVSISTTTSGATIRYSTDGDTPTGSSPVYSSPVSVTGSGWLWAVASKTGWTDSYFAAGEYTLNFGTLAAPTPTPGTGTSVDSVQVTLSAAAGASIRYTTNGTEPSATSTLYTGAVTLTTTTTLKAKAFKADWTVSPTATATYTLEVAAPAFAPTAGTYTIGQAISFSCATPSATIHYTIDGTEPTQSDAWTLSGGSVFVGNFTLKAKAFAAGMSPSATTSATYSQSGTPAGGSAAGGAAHSLLLKPDGSVWAWGANSSGQLGDGTTTQRTSPVQVSVISSVAAIAAGASHSLALTTGGNVYAWGSNASGQLGVGATPTSTSTPAQITSLTGMVAVAAGDNHSLAVKSDGSLWAWGTNANGQLGDGSTTARNTPVQVTVAGGAAIASVIGVGAGATHSLAVKSDGTAWAWGLNTNGQVGNGGTTSPQTRAVQVNTITGVTAVDGGGKHSVARTSDGTGWAWGYNWYGQLGDGTNGPATSPQEVLGLPGVSQVIAGEFFSMALSDWMVSTWGDDVTLGTGSTSNTNVAGTLSSLPPIVAIGAGNTHAIAVAQDGSVWTWGNNGSGRLGDGTTVERRTPVKVAEANFAWKVATPVFSHVTNTYTTTLNVTITTATSGASLYYTTDGSTPTTSSTSYAGAISITQTTTLRALAVKAGLADSNVYTAVLTLQGANPGISPFGGTHSTDKTVTLTSSSPGVTIRYTTNGATPTATDPGLSSGQTVTVTQSLTLKASSWRTGWVTSNVATATFVMKAAKPAFSPNGGVFTATQSVTVSCTTSGAVIRYSTSGREPTEADPVITSGSALLLSTSATLKAKAFRSGWTPSDTASATFVLNLGTAAAPTFSPVAGTYTSAQNVSVSSTTSSSTIRYTVDGTDPSPTSPIFAAPIPVPATLTVKARAYRLDLAASSVSSAAYTIDSGAVEAPAMSVSSGSYTTRRSVVVSCATSGATIRYTTNGVDPTTADTTITSGGTVVIDRSTVLKATAWKSGMTTSAVTRRDYLVTGAIAAGGTHTLALKEDGTLWAWGTNASGELGDGTTTQRTSPVQVSGLSSVVAIAAGSLHSLALKSDGTLWAWGKNDVGQVGDGTTGTNRLSPVQVTGLTGLTVTAVAAGNNHSLAVISGGTMKAWGHNGSGRLGNNSTTNANAPVSVSSVTTAVAAAGGADHSLALLADGTVVGWGSNAQGQLGATSPSQSLVPMTVPNLSGIVGLAAGSSFSYGLRAHGAASGTIWTTGYGSFGQLGDGTLPTNRKSVAAGPGHVRCFAAGNEHGLAFRQDGSTVGWGADDYGQLGDGTQIPNRPNPVKALGAGELVQLAAGSDYSVALRADGTVYTWGFGGANLGLGSLGIRMTPTPVPNFSVATNTWMNEDTDGDGLPNAVEYRLGSDPLNADTNQDGISDGAEIGAGRTPTSVDTDGDGLTNTEEAQKGTDPLLADTDGDGTIDGADCYPLDSSRTACGSSNPSDVTPPTITLDEPPGATPVP